MKSFRRRVTGDRTKKTEATLRNRRPGGIEPLRTSSTADLKSAPWTSKAQAGKKKGNHPIPENQAPEGT